MSVTDSAFIKAYRHSEQSGVAAQQGPQGATVVTDLAGATSERVTMASTENCSTIYSGPGTTEQIPGSTENAETQVVLPHDEVKSGATLIRADRASVVTSKGPYAWRRKALRTSATGQGAENSYSYAGVSEPVARPRTSHTPFAPHRQSRVSPGWEVDYFQIPQVCERLQRECATQLTDVIRSVLQRAWQGRNILAITSFAQAEGVTSLAITLAHLASSFDIHVALVDGNSDRPALGRSLGLAFKQGWEALGPEVPFEEIAIQSANSSMVVVPHGMSFPSNNGDRAAQPSELIAELTSRFELVVLDAGPMYAAAHSWFSHPTVDGIHGTIVVRDTRSTHESKLRDVLARLETAQVQSVGIIENFVTPR